LRKGLIVESSSVFGRAQTPSRERWEHAECVAPILLGFMLQEFPDAHASLRFMRTTTPKLVSIIMGDFVAQQAGRYELVGWLPAGDTAIRQHANPNASSTACRFQLSRAAMVQCGRRAGLETRHGAHRLLFPLAPTVPGGGHAGRGAPHPVMNLTQRQSFRKVH